MMQLLTKKDTKAKLKNKKKERLGDYLWVLCFSVYRNTYI